MISPAAAVTAAEWQAGAVTDPQKLQVLTLVHFLVFTSDFVSNWFHNYSIYLAGER